MDKIICIIKIMKQNIYKNSNNKIDSKLYTAHYYDFMLHKGSTFSYSSSYLNDVKIVDFSSLNIKDGVLYSDVSWSKAYNKGVKMNDIGFTGVDNGFISFRKDIISNEEFLNLYINSKFNIPSGDTRLFLTPVTGNTQNYIYPMSLINDIEPYISFKGGFYQGFFKLDGQEYQVLPNKLENTLTLHFNIRPRSDYEEFDNTINTLHPENKGIFFYMGTRAENKFWQFYKYDKNLMESFKIKEIENDDYFADGFYSSEEVPIVFMEDKWILDEEIPNECPNSGNKCIENEYIGTGITIDKEGYNDSEGHEYNKQGYKEFETDNKFILFNKTKTGFTINNWVEGTKAILSERKNWPNANYFLLMNRTKTGYTINTIDEYNNKQEYDYNIYKDLRGNTFALRITDDGAIGYKYGIYDCNEENKYNVIEEYSKTGIVKNDEWNKINVQFTITSKEYMKILFYVNGYLIFVSKDIPAFNFKSLDEVSQKQEGVPYNISIGGGALGLLETIVPNYYAITDYILPIERDFCGSFIGDIKTFKMYEGPIDYSVIFNYLS